MGPMPVRRKVTPRSILGTSLTIALASCVHFGPPSVAPSATLGPHDGAAAPPARRPSPSCTRAPKGVLADRNEPAVTALFNRAMRDLDTPQEQGVPALLVRTSSGATIAGSTRWVGTRGLLFQPERELPGATSFEVVVPAGVRALDGSTLNSDYRFAFATPKLGVTTVRAPRGEGPLAPKDTIRIVFNQAVDPAEVQKAATLTARASSRDKASPLGFVAARGSTLGLRDTPASRVVAITPASPMPLDSAIEFVLPKGLKGAEGDMRMEAPYTFERRTYGPLRLVSFNCPRVGRSGPCQARNDVRVKLNNPVEAGELERHVRAPGLLGRVKAKRNPKAPPLTEHFIGADPRRGKKYKVTITAGLRDIYGQRLERDASFEIEAEAPFVGKPPSEKKADDDVAKRPDEPPPRPTDGPARPQLRYELALGLQGHVVEALTNKGIKSHRLPVGAVNIPTFGLVSASLAESQTLIWLGQPTRERFLEDNRLAYDLITTGAPENTRAVRSVDLDGLLAPSKGPRLGVRRARCAGRIRRGAATRLGHRFGRQREGQFVRNVGLGHVARDRPPRRGRDGLAAIADERRNHQRDQRRRWSGGDRRLALRPATRRKRQAARRDLRVRTQGRRLDVATPRARHRRPRAIVAAGGEQREDVARHGVYR